MAMTYSYDPTAIRHPGVDKLRFELGDTDTDGGKETCALCDEEYQSMLNQATEEDRGWSYTKYLCLQAITMKFSFEVDSSVSGLNLSLSHRYKVWNEMLVKMQRSFQVPTANPSALGEGQPDQGHYFNLGTGNNPRVLAPSTQHRGYPYL